MKSPPSKRPQLAIAELHQLRWLLGGVVTLVSAWSMLYLEIEATALMLVVTLAVVSGLVWPRLPSRVPAFVHTFAFPLIVAFFLGDLWLKGDALPAIVRLDLMLLLYRGVSYRQRRDDLQIIVLGLFLIVVAGVLTVSLLFAVQLLAFAAASLALLLVLTLLQGIEPAAKPPAPGTVPEWVDVDWRRLFARLRQVSDWRVLMLGGLLFAGVVGVSALLFVVMPRFQLENSLFLERFAARKARAGFNDTIRFGDVTDIQQDFGVAVSVDVSDRAQVPASPYWRMVVLDEYQKGGVFKLSPALRRFEAPKTDLVLTGGARGTKPVTWTFYLEPGVGRYLPLLGRFEELRFTELQNYRYSRALAIVALRDDPASMTAYRVDGFELGDVLTDPEFAALWRDREGVSNAPTLQIGLDALEESDRETLARIAAEIANSKVPEGAEGTRAERFVAQAIVWLRGHHGYTTSPRIPTGRGDPLMLWLNSRENGHCELFAGSLVILARAAGFPARVATGFRGGSWNGYSNSLTLRNSDAHAWAEIFDEEKRGWRRADALGAPVSAGENAAAAGAIEPARRVERGWSARLESLRIFWYRRIVSFDRQSQVETLKAIKDRTEDSGRKLRERWQELAAHIKAWWSTPWDGVRWSQILLTATGLVLVFWATRRVVRRGWRFWFLGRNTKAPDPVRLDAGRWLERLKTVEASTPEDVQVVADLQRLRFGARSSWPEPKRVFRQATRAARRRVTG